MLKYDVPFYRQSLDFTCGPASLMMAMACFDKGIKLNRALELDIWREANLVEVWGTSRYGLALASKRRGFPTRIVNNTKDMGYAEIVPKYRRGIDRKWMKFFLNDLKKKCASNGIVEDVKRFGLPEIRKILKEGGIPVALVNAELLSNEYLPHWIVFKGFDKNLFYINNPLDTPKKRKVRIPSKIIQKSLGFMGFRSLVVVNPPEK
jgi:hypothetical protein